MSLHLPANLAETDDVAVASVHERLTVHRPGDVATPCGEPMWAMRHPAPAAGHVLHLHPTFCERCFPRDNAWAQMLALAYPSRFRTADVNGRRDQHLNTTSYVARSGTSAVERKTQ